MTLSASQPERSYECSEELNMTDLPLRGIRVIDFSWLGAGPYATKILADHGADVIRIESSTRIDRLRILPPFRDGIKGNNRSGYFADRNSNKRGIALNMRHESALDIAKHLIAVGDVVVNNFTPGTMERMGIGYEAARALRPDVIYLEMGTQGANGVDSRRPGYGNTVSSVTGLHHLSGDPDRYPVGTGTNYPDHVVAPAHAAFVVLVALRHRRRTGEGQYIDLSQAETMIGLLGPAILDYTVNGRVQMRRGNLSHGAAPHGVYRCLGDDRWIAIAVRSDTEWIALTDGLGLASLRNDSRYATLSNRHRHQAELDDIIGTSTSQHDAHELASALQERGVPVGVVQTAQDLIEVDRQLRHREHFPVLDHPEMGPSIYNAPPFRLRGVDEPVMRMPAPLLGQHTREVLAGVLGMSEDEIDRLEKEEVLT
jgi:benzylsuccinate CoA-transferase BbsF subunit